MKDFRPCPYTAILPKANIFRWIQIISWVIIFALLTSCSSKDDVVEIRQIIKESATLAEEHDVGELIERTSEDFLALPGRHDRLEVKRIIWLAFRHYGSFRILYHEPVVDLSDDDTAIAELHFIIIKKERSFPKLKKLFKDPQAWLEEVGL